MTPTSLEADRLKLIADYAAPIIPFLSESAVLDVCVNEEGGVWVNRLGGGWREEESMLPVDSINLLQAIATVRRKELNEQYPILETTFPLTGDRIEGLITPIVTAPIFAIRTRPKQIYTVADYAAQGVLTGAGDPMNTKCEREGFLDLAAKNPSHEEIVQLSTRFRQNVLLVGPTGSGKTSFGNALIADWKAQTPNDRVVIIEDTEELQCSLPNFVQLLANEHVSQARLLEVSLRLIPKRIVVGEVRAAEAAKVLLMAWNTGHRGGLATIHADNALAGLRKLETFLGSHDGVVREQIADAIGLVIFIDGDDRISAGRKVREVLAVKGFDSSRGDYELVRL
jgi:Flp pilus assembly CpaF family ATPase